jgi:hypothetical protein
MISLVAFVFLIGCGNYVNDKIEVDGASEDHFALSPIGDNCYGEVYSFIKDFLLKKNAENKVDLQELIKYELESLKLENTEYRCKPYRAEIYENEFAHVLSDLCKARSWRYDIILFLKDGRSVARGSKNDLTFKGERDDIYEYLGFLYPAPRKYLGIKKLTCVEDGATYYKITKAICHNKDRDCLYFSDNPTAKDDVVGYVSYIVK